VKSVSVVVDDDDDDDDDDDPSLAFSSLPNTTDI
jgi:hypothetical protein